ncbi:MAG: hypothetical protein KKF41_13815 [Actinobacteria bacterium]|nr:hypothetical protein [Actinomycetota bacterium]MBU2688652.1 hypothetical protein [Actinomycetota bacterium]
MAKSRGGKKGKAGRSSRRERSRRFTVGFLVAVLFALTAIAFFIQVQQQLAAKSALKARAVQKSITAEKTRQKELRMVLARLKSPGRVARIAQDELSMGEPGGVIYLKYTRDADGNIASESTYEKREPARPAVTPPAAEEQQDGAITRR